MTTVEAAEPTTGTRVGEWYRAYRDCETLDAEVRDVSAKLVDAKNKLSHATAALARDARFEKVRYLKVPGYPRVLLRLTAKTKDVPEVQVVIPEDCEG